MAQIFVDRLVDEWRKLNDDFFDGQMQPPRIEFSEPREPKRYGDFIPAEPASAALACIRLRPSILRGTHPHIRKKSSLENRVLFLADVLLHQMVRQWQHDIVGSPDPPSYHGYGPTFRDKCNEIGQRLLLSPIGIKARDRLPRCSLWPMNVRPQGYYGDAYNPTAYGRRRNFFTVPRNSPEAMARAVLAELPQHRDLVNFIEVLIRLDRERSAARP
jgi:hypothetical protein